MNVELRGIHKAFGSNQVLKDVSLSLQGGEVCALLGENGAGKSTLMNILGGVLPKDQGKILLDGQEREFDSPSASLEAGIAFIHQELNLINDLPIYENMFLGRELKKKSGLLDLEEMERQTAAVFAKMGVSLNPRTMVRDLDASYKQIVEISRAMMMNASMIIMDEPTTSLTDPEIQRVFEMMKTMKSHGVGIIFISHKLGEVMTICDRYAVLRDGAKVAEGEVKDVDTDLLAKLMVGHDVRTESLQREGEKGEEVLRLENLTREPYFRNISLSVHRGEILGVTGLLGDGRSELFLTVFGAEKPAAGKIILEGKEIQLPGTPHALKSGIGYLPRNRKENGIIKDMDIFENASIVTWPKFARRGFIDRTVQAEKFASQVKKLNIRMGKKTDPILSLSGGNQQKVVLAKWLTANPKVLILDNPTQGVDVGAKEDIYDIILKLAEENIAVVVLSSEAQEIIRVCSRALVMYHGAIQGEVSGPTMNEHDIMKLATGGRLNTAQKGENGIHG